MSKQKESLVSIRSEQAKRDIEKLNNELQKLIETGRNRSKVDASPISSVVLENKNVANPTEIPRIIVNQERLPIKKTDLHVYATCKKLPLSKSPPIRGKSHNENVKSYNVAETREYMQKQKEKRLNSLKNDLQSSEQNVKERKEKLKELQRKTLQIVSNNVRRSRSKSNDKNSQEVSPSKKPTQHISRRVANSDVISNVLSTSANRSPVSPKSASKNVDMYRNVTIRKKSPRLDSSDLSLPILIVSESKDLNIAATKIQAAFKGYKQRKRFIKEMEKRKISPPVAKSTATKVIEEKEVSKWLETKISSAPYNVVRTFKRKLAFSANVPSEQDIRLDLDQSSENLLRSQSREDIKQRLKDSVKNSKHKDLKSFLSHKCLDLDLKKVDDLNLISKQKLEQNKSLVESDSSDTSKNIPELSIESGNTKINEHLGNSNDFVLDINSKRLKDLKLRFKKISSRQSQQFNSTFDETGHCKTNKNVKLVGKLPKGLLDLYQENKESHSAQMPSTSSRITSIKDSSYNPTVNRSIELDSSREITLNSSRDLFNSRRLTDMLLLTPFVTNDKDVFAESDHQIIESEQKEHKAKFTENDFNKVNNNTGLSIDDQSLSNSEVEVEICSNVPKKQSEKDVSAIELKTQESQEFVFKVPKAVISSANISRSKKDSFYHLPPQSENISKSQNTFYDLPSQSAADVTLEENIAKSINDSFFSDNFESDLPTEKSIKLLSSTVLESRKSEEQEKVFPLKTGETLITTASSNQINVKFQAELHIVNDFNQSLYDLMGIQRSLEKLRTEKMIHENKNTQTSFISSNKSNPITDSSLTKNSISLPTNILNSSIQSCVNCSLFNGSIFEQFEEVANPTKDASILNDTQCSKNDDNSIMETEIQGNTLPISQEALLLQYYEQLLKDEEVRKDFLKSVIELRKSVLLHSCQFALQMLEMKRKRLLESDQLSEAAALRKKQRGILIKVQQQNYEMQRVMQMQKTAAKERKHILKQQQNVIKAQLTLNDVTTVTKIKKNRHLDRRRSGPLKVFAPSVSIHHRSSASQRRSDSSVTSRCSSSVTEDLIVTTSYRSDNVRLSDGSDNQTVASVTSITQETRRKSTTITTEQRPNKITEKDRDNSKEEEVIITDSICSNLDRVNDNLDTSLERQHENGINGDHAVMLRTQEVDMLSSNGNMDDLDIVKSQNEMKRVLLMKEHALKKRRTAVEEFLQWNQRLDEEKKKVEELEMAATFIITHCPVQQASKSPFISKITTDISLPYNQQKNISWSPSINNKMTGRESNNISPKNVSTSCENGSIEEQVITKTKNLTNAVQQDYNDDDTITRIESESQQVKKLSSKHSSDSYSCEFDPGETTDNVEEDEVSLRTVKSSDHEEDLNILKSQTTLNEIMHNISIISDEISEIYRISSGNNKLSIGEDGQLVEYVDLKHVELVKNVENDVLDSTNNEVLTTDNEQQSIKLNKDEDVTLKTAEDLSSKIVDDVTPPSVNESPSLVSNNFNLEEAEIIEQNIKKIEMEIEELQSKALNIADITSNVSISNLVGINVNNDKEVIATDLENTENAETTISNNLITDSQLKNERENSSNDVSEKLMEEFEFSSTRVSDIIDHLSSVDLIEMSEDGIGDNNTISSNNQFGSDLQLKSLESIHTTKSNLEEIKQLRSVADNSESHQIILSQNSTELERANNNALKTPNANDNSVSTPELFELDESSAEKSEILSSKAPDIIESLNRNIEAIESHNSSKMPEILENLNEAAHEDGSSKTSSPSHSSELSLEDPLPSIVRKEDEELEEVFEDFDEVSIDLPSSEAGIAIASDDILNTIRMCTQHLINQAQFGNIQDENNDLNSLVASDETSLINNESFDEDNSPLNSTYIIEKVDPKDVSDKIYDDFQSTKSADSKSNHTSLSKENSRDQSSNQINVKERVSEILSESKHKSDKSTRIQDLYTTTYDVSFTEKAPEIVSELDPEYISPKLVEVKAEELELLKKQWAIEQEIKQLEEQQLSEKREQLPYQYLREIPNKPPPPYTPPVNQLSVVTIPSVIPSNPIEVTNILLIITNYLYTCHTNKSLQSATFCSISEEITEFNSVETNELMFDLCKELTEEHYDEFRMTDGDSLPSWMRLEETISSLKKPLEKIGLGKFLEEKLMELYGFREKVNIKESSIMRWGRKKRDHVDEVLVRELQADECNWTNFEEDEVIVKDQLVDDLLDLLLKEAIDEVKGFWKAKNT